MFDALNLPTPASKPLVVWEEAIRPGAPSDPGKRSKLTPLAQRHNPSLQTTLFQEHGAWAQRTPALDLLTGATQESAKSRGNSDQGAASKRADEIANERIALLARKYASDDASRELIARLEVLNARMLAEMPRVTAEKVQTLEEVATSMRELQVKRIERANRLGLSV